MEAHLQGKLTLGEEQPAPGLCPVRIIIFSYLLRLLALLDVR